MAEKSNNIIKRELTLKSKDNESFKLAIIKEKDEIIFNSYLLNCINKFQYKEIFFNIIKYLKNINLLKNSI